MKNTILAATRLGQLVPTADVASLEAIADTLVKLAAIDEKLEEYQRDEDVSGINREDEVAALIDESDALARALAEKLKLPTTVTALGYDYCLHNGYGRLFFTLGEAKDPVHVR